ncbi:sensor histidine kinase [Nonomuraea soli]|uniref:histidine kinase n=1 Tax=Nonomuraea soli TaxID=1032476 RepID=A0A7W0CG19_9ACTN|nr:histidine kinase [Nonomuraea soli]MBA2890509.1 signal transduction histidine kinase [Nonomuraea soli]
MLSALVRPFQLALFTGEADPPPPRSRFLRFPLRRPLGPFQHVDLRQLAEFVLGWVLYGTTLNDLLASNGLGAAIAGRPHEQPEVFLHLAAICCGLPVALRDRYPLGAWRVAIVLMPVTLYVMRELASGGAVPYSGQLIVSYLLVLYSAAARGDASATAAAWVISVLMAWIAHPDSLYAVIGAVSVAALFGYNVRSRRRAADRLVQEELRTQAAQGAQSVLAERARIARELHDVVAHHMSVIAIQAEAVPLKARGDARQLEEGLAGIRALSLEAIAELRQILGVLRDEEGRLETTPQPGLDRVDELVANARAAGLAVVVKRSGSMEGVPVAVALSAYRIVQESLSNVMRHAPGAPVALELARTAGELRVHVVNRPSPTGAAPAPGGGGGHGLAGMRERVALHGGTVEAGPLDDGGFRVLATLRLEAA